MKEKKKNKKIKLVVLSMLMMLLFTGCTTYLKDKDGKTVTNPVTSQNMTKNILCKPKKKEALNIYKENKIDVSKLPDCDNFKIWTKYDGLWTGVVEALAWVILKIGEIVRNYGLALIITSLLIRLAMFPVTRKTALQSELIKKAKPELDKLEGKYKDKKDNDSMMKKSQEMAMIYKKYNINPISGCLFAFLQLPLFIGFLEAINRVPAIFEENFLGLQLGTTPWNAITNNKEYFYLYIILIIAVAVSTYFSTKFNAAATSGDNSQMKTMNIVMLVMITTMSFVTSSALGIYWLTSSVFTIVQNLIVRKDI